MAQAPDRLELERQRTGLARQRRALNQQLREAQAQGDQWNEQHVPLPPVDRIFRRVSSNTREATQAPDEDIIMYQNIMDPDMTPIRERPKLRTYDEKRAWAKFQKDALFNRFKREHPNYTDADIRHAIADARRDYNALVRGYPRILTDKEKEARRQAREDLTDYRMANPTGIYDPSGKMAPVLHGLKGEAYNDNQFIAKGSRFRHDDRRREYFGRVFAELTGVAGLMPKFNPALTTVESAKEVFPPEDYDIQAYDMDSDENTPYTVIIRKKLRNRRGELTGNFGPIIAANGYYLPENTPALQLRRLRQMDWMRHNPTKLERRINPYGAYIAKSPALGKEAVAFKALTEWVKSYWAQLGFTAPRPNDPAIMKLWIDQNKPDGDTVYYKLAGPAYNSLMANLTRLFGMYYILPTIREVWLPGVANQLPKHQSLGSNVLGGYDGGWDRIDLFRRMTTTKLEKSLILPVGLVRGKSAEQYRSNVFNLWKRWQLHPKVERLVYNYRFVKESISDILKGLKARELKFPSFNDFPKLTTDYMEIFDVLFQVVCLFHMNFQFGELVSYFGGDVSASEAKLFGDPGVVSKTFPGLWFLPICKDADSGRPIADKIRAQTAGMSVDDPLPVLNMTAKKRETVNQQNGVIERGTDLIGKPADDSYMNGVAEHIRQTMQRIDQPRLGRVGGDRLVPIHIRHDEDDTQDVADNVLDGISGEPERNRSKKNPVWSRDELFANEQEYDKEWKAINEAPSFSRSWGRSTGLDRLRNKATPKVLLPYTPETNIDKWRRIMTNFPTTTQIAHTGAEGGESESEGDQDEGGGAPAAPKRNYRQPTRDRDELTLRSDDSPSSSSSSSSSRY